MQEHFFQNCHQRIFISLFFIHLLRYDCKINSSLSAVTELQWGWIQELEKLIYGRDDCLKQERCQTEPQLTTGVNQPEVRSASATKENVIIVRSRTRPRTGSIQSNEIARTRSKIFNQIQWDVSTAARLYYIAVVIFAFVRAAGAVLGRPRHLFILDSICYDSRWFHKHGSALTLRCSRMLTISLTCEGFQILAFCWKKEARVFIGEIYNLRPLSDGALESR